MTHKKKTVRILCGLLLAVLLFEAPLEGGTQVLAYNNNGKPLLLLGEEQQDDTDASGQEKNSVKGILGDFTQGVSTIGQTAEESQSTSETADGAEEETSKADLKTVLGRSEVGVSTLFQEKTDEEYIQAAKDAVGAAWGYTNLGISNVSDNLNIRSIPAEDGKLVGKLPKNAACEVLEETEDGWAHITSGEIEGYVKAEYLLIGPSAKQRVREFLTTNVRVTTDGLNVREEPSEDAEVVTMVAEGEELELIEEMGEWVKVFLDDQSVYVSAQYVEIKEELSTAISMTEVLYGPGVSDIRASVCQYALQFRGNPYVWGGTSLTKGADCSGFTMSVFKNFGVSLPHSSVSQATMGTTIKVSEAQPGDLIFYGNGKRINHVAICIGNGQIVHASNPKTGIRTSSIYYRTPVKAVRILYD